MGKLLRWHRVDSTVVAIATFGGFQLVKRALLAENKLLTEKGRVIKASRERRESGYIVIVRQKANNNMYHQNCHEEKPLRFWGLEFSPSLVFH